MPRKVRVEYPGAVYHVMNRGDRRENIFLEDVDRQDFLKTLAEACQKTGWQVHAYCLMSNHFHLVLETPNAGLVAGMRWLLSSYTIRLNHRHHLFGHVFSGRYKALLIDATASGYLRTACDYVHLNPVRANLLEPQEKLLAYPWTSLGSYFAARDHRPGWIRVDRLLGEHGVGDTALGRQEFERRMEARRLEDPDEAGLEAMRRGWYLGGEEFKKQMLERMEEQLRPEDSGQLRWESAEVKAERIIQEELGRRGWTPADLSKRRKSDPDRLAMAARIRRETTLTIKWIATRLQMGTSKSTNARLHSWMQTNPEAARDQVQTVQSACS